MSQSPIAGAKVVVPNGHKDKVGARVGMWLFLFTEVLLFGGLFLLYAVYRHNFPEDFHFAASTLDTFMGTINTLILLTSSMTVVLAISYLEKRDRKKTSVFLTITIFLGVLFLVNKYFEWNSKIHHGLFPNSEVMQAHTPGENIFYSLYYLMTGLHGLHIIIGLIILGTMLYLIKRRPRHKIKISNLNTSSLNLQIDGSNSVWKHNESEIVSQVNLSLIYGEHEDITDRLEIKLENSGLYWHLVDVIWIFLFPLFYLIT